MPRLEEEKLACNFPANWEVTKYDDWVFYRNHFQVCCNGNKGIDFLGFEPAHRVLWLIELKDYRQGPRDKAKIALWEEVAIKARDTLAGLFAAKVEAGHPDQPFAIQSTTARKIRLVLHLEQPRTHSRLFPRIFDRADVQQKLKQLVKPIDAHPAVVELHNMGAVPWGAESVP
jgi:hypothetical protein